MLPSVPDIDMNPLYSLDWEKAGVKFFIGGSLVHRWKNGDLRGREVYIESRDQMDGSQKWVVKMDSWVLTKNLTYVYEPMPSSRTDKFIEKTRFDSKEEALGYLRDYEKKYTGKEVGLLIPKII